MTQEQTRKAGYRPDIDGLRAVAVLSVLLFHLRFSGIPGGFLGVDIFFVISGFIITRLIVEEVRSTGGFRFGSFYARRIRRLVPAMLAIFAFTFLCGFLLSSAENFKSYATSLLYAIAHLSNFYFWGDSDYFILTGQARPLLHLWSLAVEMQFYLVWPIILVCLLRLKRTWAVILFLVATIIFSLLLNHVFFLMDLDWLMTMAPRTATRLTDKTASLFYLTPFRVFEFAIGALLVWGEHYRSKNVVLREIMPVIGSITIAACLLFVTKNTPYLFYATFVLCLGTAAVLYSKDSTFSGLVLSNPLMVGIGLLSYSLYLIHWPLIIFYLYYTLRPITFPEQIALIAISFAAALLMYLWIEQPFRRPIPGKRFTSNVWVLSGCVVVSLLIFFVGERVSRHNGWIWRIPKERQITSTSMYRWMEEMKYCGTNLDTTKSRSLFVCQNFIGKTKDIFLWGDSHSRHLAPGFVEAFPDYNIFNAYLPSCAPQNGTNGYQQALYVTPIKTCIAQNKAVLEFLRTYKPSVVILSSRKPNDVQAVGDATNILLEELRSYGHTAYLLGDLIEPTNTLSNCSASPSWLLPDSVQKTRCVADPIEEKIQLTFNHSLKSIVKDAVMLSDFQCPNDICQYTNSGGHLFRDGTHLNIPGSIYFVNRVKDELLLQQ